MAFGEYYNSMDRRAEHAEKEVQVNPGELGISTIITRDALQPLQTRIFAGANQVEIGFLGTGKGDIFGGRLNPESIGKEQRQAIRELAKINKVELSTHASVQIAGFSGITDQGFNDQQRQAHINEIKRAVEFAADTAGGGAIVIHTGEWRRPLFSAAGGQGYNKQLQGLFEWHEKEKEKGIMFIADEKGSVQTIKRDMKIQVLDKDGQGNPQFNEDGTYKVKEKTFQEIVEEERQLDPNISEEKAFLNHHFRNEEERKRAESLRFRYEAERLEREAQNAPEDRRRELDQIAKSYREASIAYSKELEQIERTKNELKPIEEVGIKKSAEGIALAAMYAFEVEKKKQLDKPLYVAPENIFPEWGFGSHPQELKKLILTSREEMARRLQTKGMGEEEAKKVATSHIRGTFDVGHANVWRKYFKGDEKDFNKWMIENVRDLLKSNVLGHVHMSDNFGYEDEHLTVGEGNVPWKEFMQELKEHEKRGGIKIDTIVETGAQPPEQQQQALYGAWAYFGSPIYGSMAPKVGVFDRWTDVQNSYFGKTSSPNYVVGDFRPSEEWTLWSGTLLE